MRPLSKLERQRQARERAACELLAAERDAVTTRQTAELEALLATDASVRASLGVADDIQ